MNNNAFGLVSGNILRRCSLGVGAGPAGALASAANSTPFSITANLIEDCDYGLLAIGGTVIFLHSLYTCISLAIIHTKQTGGA
jgi:hypothetical protein